jgi:SAM-dependent methyltransferase
VSQISLLGEPELKSERSQWFTAMWICRLLVQWVPPTARVLEPSCGSGNMIAALLERGHDPKLIHGAELDAEWADFARKRFNGEVMIDEGDFFDMHFWPRPGQRDAFDVILGNPPFEENRHERFIMRGLELASTINFIVPVSVEFSRDRDHDLWAQRAIVRRRAKLPHRVKYGGKNQASFDSEALKIVRRESVREPGEINWLMEEVWTRVDDAKGMSPK